MCNAAPIGTYLRENVLDRDFRIRFGLPDDELEYFHQELAGKGSNGGQHESECGDCFAVAFTETEKILYLRIDVCDIGLAFFDTLASLTLQTH
jgi:hypothetical protein